MNGRTLPLLLALSALGFACQDEKKETKRVDAGPTNKIAQLDTKIASALGSASPAASAAEADKKPPASGIFPPGVADKIHAKGAPVKIEIGSEGESPRVLLSTAEPKGPATLTVAATRGRAALPTIDYALIFAPSDSPPKGLPKPVAAAKDTKEGKDDKDAAAPSNQSGGPAAATTAWVQKITLNANQPGQIPPDMAKLLEGMNGAELPLLGGPMGLFSVKPAKGRAKELDDVLALPAAALQGMFVHVAGKPIGAGGFWMAQSRTKRAGVEVISYRAYRVKSAKADSMQVSVEIREYAVSGDLDIEGLPKQMSQFQSVGKAELELIPGDSVPVRGEYAQDFAMLFGREGQPGQQFQSHTEARIVRPNAPPAGSAKPSPAER